MLIRAFEIYLELAEMFIVPSPNSQIPTWTMDQMNTMEQVPCSHVLPSQPGNRGERQHAGGRCVRQSREPRPGEGKPIGSGGVRVARRTGNRRRRPRKADATATILPIQSNSRKHSRGALWSF